MVVEEAGEVEQDWREIEDEIGNLIIKRIEDS